MKKFIVGFICGLVFSSGFASAITTEELYRFFGPKLIHAIVIVVKNEINILRVANGLEERNNEQMKNAIKNELDNIPDYNWMEALK